jgi:LysR family transcriptional regulator for bpeEF and oprC
MTNADMDRVRQMEVFIQVMESGNFTRAANVLGLPRSTVTTVIQSLEDRVGTQLLLRSTRQMVPTEEGHRFLATAGEIVEAVNDTDRMFQPRDNRLQGKLRIDMPNRIGRRIVIPALPAFISLNPDLKIEVSTSDSMVDLIAEGLDCIIRIGSPDDSDIICKKLGDLPMITCCSPAYLERQGPLESIDQLADHKMVKYGPSLPTRPASFVHKALSQTIEIPVSDTLTVNNAEAYIAAARAGLGLIQIQDFEVRDHLRSGELVAVLHDVQPPPMPLSLLYARRRNVPARVDRFKTWVGDLFRREGVFERGTM